VRLTRCENILHGLILSRGLDAPVLPMHGVPPSAKALLHNLEMAIQHGRTMPEEKLHHREITAEDSECERSLAVAGLRLFNV
jgi:hypothetical protein